MNDHLQKLHRISPKSGRSHSSLWIAVACLCALSASCAYAEDKDKDAFVTDRPDFVESSEVVGAGHLQIETSFAIERNNADTSRTRVASTPTLLRIGLNKDWELRVETDGRIVSHMDDLASGIARTERGYADLSLGLKWHVQDEVGTAPSLAVLAHLDLPSGSQAWRGDGTRPSLRIAAEWALPNDMSLGVMPGVIIDKNAKGERFAGGLFGVVVGKSWTEKAHTFVELAASQIARSSNGGTVATLDVGAAYLLSPRLQLDAAYNKGLNRNAPDSAWTVGLSAKF